MSKLAHDGLFWRKLAAWGAQHGPSWWVEYSPPYFGLAAAVLVPSARRAVLANLRRIRGEAGLVRDVTEVGETFTTYAGCLAEVLSNGSKNAQVPEAEVIGQDRLLDVAAQKKGVVVVTIHSAGWETVGPLFSKAGLRVMMAMEPERDARARALQDEARKASGLLVAHVGGRRPGFAAALAAPAGRRGGGLAGRPLAAGPSHPAGAPLGGGWTHPAGALCGSLRCRGRPLLPIFCSRTGFRRYRLEALPPIHVPRRAHAGRDRSRRANSG